MELKAYFHILLKKWWVVIPAFLVTFTATVVFTFTQTPVYEAKTTLIVSPSSLFETTQSQISGLSVLSTRSEIATTYTEVAQSGEIKREVVKELGLSSAQARSLSVSSKLRAGTNVLEIAVRGSDPTLVRDFTNVVGVKTVAYVEQLYEVYELKLLDLATLPSSPISPDKKLNLALGGVLGLVLGIGLAFLAEYLQQGAQRTGLNFEIMDEETGVYNKQYFTQRLKEEMVRAKRNHYPLSLALMRVNNLNLFNGLDSSKVRLGLIRQIALLLGQYLREEDILAHLGQNVFSVILPDVTGDNAKAIMEYLQARIALTSLKSVDKDLNFNPQGAVGIASYNHNGTSCDDFVAQANHALALAEVGHDGKTYLITDTTVHKNEG